VAAFSIIGHISRNRVDRASESVYTPCISKGYYTRKTAEKRKQKPKKRVSPVLNVTLPPLTKALGMAQARKKGITYSKHIRDLIEAESTRA
jgi:hypothetical protein